MEKVWLLFVCLFVGVRACLSVYLLCLSVLIGMVMLSFADAIMTRSKTGTRQNQQRSGKMATQGAHTM